MLANNNRKLAWKAKCLDTATSLEEPNYGNCIMFPADALKEGETSLFVSRNTVVESLNEMSTKIA